MSIETCAFSTWLTTQWYRHDGIGELAAVARSDPHYPKVASSATTKKYLMDRVVKEVGHRCTNPETWLEQAELEYQRVQDAARDVHVAACAILAECARLGFTVTPRPTTDPNIVGLMVRGPGIRTGEEKELAQALPGDLFTRFVAHRDVIAYVLTQQKHARR